MDAQSPLGIAVFLVCCTGHKGGRLSSASDGRAFGVSAIGGGGSFSGFDPHDPASDRLGGSLGPVTDAEFLEGVADVSLHGVLGDAEGGGDLLVGAAFRDQGENLAFRAG